MSALKPTASTTSGPNASASSTTAAGTTAAAAVVANTAASVGATASASFPSEQPSQVESAPIIKADLRSPSDRPDATTTVLPSEYAMSLPPPAVLATGRKASVSLHLFAGSASSKQQHSATKDKSLKSQSQQPSSSLPQSQQQLSAARSPAAAPELTRSPTAPTPITKSKRHASTGDRSSLPASTAPATPLDLLGQINLELVSFTRSASTDKRKDRTGSASTPAVPQQKKPGSPPPLAIASALPATSSSTTRTITSSSSNREVPCQANLVTASHVPIPEEAVSTSDTEGSSYDSSNSDSFSTANGDEDEQEDEQNPSQSRAQSISIPSRPTSIRRGGEGSSLSRSLRARTAGSASIPLLDQSGSGEEDEDEHSELPTVIQLQPFYNQVGGHSSIFQFSSHAVCKPLVSRENQFYESLERNGRQLLRFVPRYLGVLNVSFRPVYPEDPKPPSEGQQPEPDPTSSFVNSSSSPHQAPPSTRSPATQPGTPGLPPKRKIFKGQNMDDVEVPEVAVELNRHLMPEWVLGEEEGTHSPHPTLWALEHPRPHYHQRTQHGLSAPSTHPSHPWPSSSSNVAGSSSRRSYDSGAMSDSDTRQCSPRSPYSSSPQSPNPIAQSPRTNRSPARSEGKARHGSVPHTPLRAPLGLTTNSAQAATSTPGSTPRPTTPNTPSTSTHPPGSQTCVFGRGSTAVNQRLQAQVLREVFSASNLRDTAAAARRRTQSSRAGSSQSRRSHSSTRHEARARSTDRTGRSYEGGGRNPTPPPPSSGHSDTPMLSSTHAVPPHPMTPASHSEDQSGYSAPTSPGSFCGLRDPLQMSQSHPTRSPQSISSPSSRPTSLRARAAMAQTQQKDISVDESLDPGASTSRAQEELFEMDDWHAPEGIPTPPVSNPDLASSSHHASCSPSGLKTTPISPEAAHNQDDPEPESPKGDKDPAARSSWLDAGGHEKLLRSGYFLLMEDLTGRLRAPCVLDLKMGTRQYSLDATDAKRASQSSKAAATTSRTHGARICGMQVYHCPSLSYTFQDKYFGRKVRPNEFESALEHFLHNGQTLLVHHVPGIVTQLRQLARIVHQLPGYRFYASSLLFIYDGDCATQQRLMAHFERRAKEGRAGVPPAWAVAGPNINDHPTRSASTSKEHGHHHHHHHHHHSKPHRGEMKIRIIDFAHSTTGRDYRFAGEEFISPLANQSDHGDHDQDPWWHQTDLYADKEELYEEQEAKEEEAFAEWLSRPIVRFAPSHPEGPDSGYLWGLKNLTAAFEGIWEKERHARVVRARQEAVAHLHPTLVPPSLNQFRRSTGEGLTGHAERIVDRAGSQADLGPLQASDPGVFDEIFDSKLASQPTEASKEDEEKGYVSDKDHLDYMAATNQSNPNSTSTSTPGRSTATVTPVVASPIRAAVGSSST